MNTRDNLALSLESGFIDCNLTSLKQYNPRLLVNDHKKGMKVLSTIESELRGCREFYFSVAFITDGGVESLLAVLQELRDKNIHGRIVTSQYQNFTQPKALRRLLKFSNIELRIVTEGNFHAKGYLFSREDDTYSIIIGSSNMTQDALSRNKEWNVKLSSLENGSIMQNILREYDYTFNNATVVDEAWITEYEKIYMPYAKALNNANKASENNVISLTKINPNKMQVEALDAIERLRKSDKNKGLLISATGTGKTYLSAFDVKKYQPDRFLFVVHRENIAREAMASYKRILGPEICTGILTGGQKDPEAKYLFSTIQTLSKEETLRSFAPDAFDYIVIDEAHHSGAETYQRVLEYFEPKFLLGMTATPERTDGYDIFEKFDHNIAYEIRLNRALEENMLSPFHYFGVSEIKIGGELLDDNAEFNQLTCNERIERIIEAADFYGYSGDRVRGLVFCSRKEEAKELSRKFNEYSNCGRRFNTLALTGESSEVERENAIKRLEQKQIEEHLDYIFTVDIFNEGVDIPTVNQVIMLRPTQSAIIFVQQLGRGLRKAYEKEYLTVIDFIGNYSNNYLVPIALYGDRSFNKDTVRKMVNSGSSIIPGCSTVNFDQITKERIFKSIDSASLQTLALLREDYRLVKYQLGRVPMMLDFMEIGSREPYAFVGYSDSYYEFVCKVDARSVDKMPVASQNLLEFYSIEILNGKRIEESILLTLLTANGNTSFGEIVGIIKERFKINTSHESVESAISNLNGQFIKDKAASRYGISENINVVGEKIIMDEEYRATLNHSTLGIFLQDMIRYSIRRFRADFVSENWRKGFLLYSKYSRKDVCRILNWEKNEESTIYGYRIKYNTCPIFVTYNKGNDISESTKYEDAFINPHTFSWMTRSRVTLKSGEVQAIDGYRETGLRIPLFVKKSDGEGTDFYYMGDVIPLKRTQEKMKDDKGETVSVVNYVFAMNDEVEEGIYNYLEA